MRFNLKEGSFINYEIFSLILNYYKDSLTESNICSILGIDECRFHNIKYNDGKTKIFNGVTKDKIMFMKKNFLETRFYSKKEIVKSLDEYEVSIDDFIIHIVNNSTFTKTDDYLSALQKNNGLFIGKNPVTVDEDFFIKHYDNLFNISKYIIFSIINLCYIENEAETIQDILIYIYQKCGDLYYNFGDSRTFFTKVIGRARKYIYGRLVDESRYKNGAKVLLLSHLDYSIPLENRSCFKDQNVNIEEEVINSLEQNEDLIYEKMLTLIQNNRTIDECFQIMEQSYRIKENSAYQKVKEKIINFNKID